MRFAALVRVSTEQQAEQEWREKTGGGVYPPPAQSGCATSAERIGPMKVEFMVCPVCDKHFELGRECLQVGLGLPGTRKQVRWEVCPEHYEEVLTYASSLTLEQRQDLIADHGV